MITCPGSVIFNVIWLIRWRHRSDFELLQQASRLVKGRESSQGRSTAGGHCGAQILLSIPAEKRDLATGRIGELRQSLRSSDCSRDSFKRPAERPLPSLRSCLVAGDVAVQTGTGPGIPVARGHRHVCDLRISNRRTDQLFRQGLFSSSFQRFLSAGNASGWILRERQRMVLVCPGKAETDQRRAIVLAAQRLCGLASPIDQALGDHPRPANFQLAPKQQRLLRQLESHCFGLANSVAAGSKRPAGDALSEKSAENMQHLAQISQTGSRRFDHRPCSSRRGSSPLHQRRDNYPGCDQRFAHSSRLERGNAGQTRDSENTVLTGNSFSDSHNSISQFCQRESVFSVHEIADRAGNLTDVWNVDFKSSHGSDDHFHGYFCFERMLKDERSS